MQVSGVEMKRWMDDLLPIILDMLQDSSSLQKREVLHQTFGMNYQPHQNHVFKCVFNCF